MLRKTETVLGKDTIHVNDNMHLVKRYIHIRLLLQRDVLAPCTREAKACYNTVQAFFKILLTKYWLTKSLYNELWGDGATWWSLEDREWNKEGVSCAEAVTQGRKWSCTEGKVSCSRNRNNSGRNMHSRMKLCLYKLRIHPSSWQGVDMVRNVVDQCKRFRSMHAIMHKHAPNPFNTLTKVKTRSKSNQSWTCTSESWCAWPLAHTWRSARTLCISVFPV